MIPAFSFCSPGFASSERGRATFPWAPHSRIGAPGLSADVPTCGTQSEARALPYPLWFRVPEREFKRVPPARGHRPALSILRRWAASCCLTLLMALPAAASELFPDPALEAAVRTQVFAKRGTEAPLVEADVANLSTIEAKGRGITNLAGLEKCRSLAMLDLAGNKVSDLGPLSGLQRLQFLDVQSNRVENLKPLSSVTALQYLHLAQNKVEDLVPLAGLTNLSALYLTGNRVEDIRPLLDLRRLSSLYLDRNRIRDISGIGQIRGLSSLSLSYNRVQDLRALHGLNRLQHLFLEHNRIRDLAPVVTWVKADAEQRFAPFLNLYLADNPLGSAARRDQLKEVESAGVRVHRGGEAAKRSAPAH